MDKQYCKEVGQRLYSLRKNLRLTRAELGKKVDLHETTIKRYEDGEIKKLDIAKIKDFARALETTSAYIMGWENNYSYNEGVADAKLLKKIRQLTPEEKADVDKYIDFIISRKTEQNG